MVIITPHSSPGCFIPMPYSAFRKKQLPEKYGSTFICSTRWKEWIQENPWGKKSFLVFLAEWIGEARERWKSTTWIRGFKLGDKENHDTTSKNRKNKNWFWEKSIAFTWDRILKLMTEYSNRNVSRKLLIK